MPRLPIYRCTVAGLIFNLTLGSSAAINRHGKGYAIAVNSGSALQLFNALQRLVAYPDTLRSHRSAPGKPLAGRLGLPLLTGSVAE
jgi:hypothetical protein